MNITIYLGPRTGSSVDASHIEKVIRVWAELRSVC